MRVVPVYESFVAEVTGLDVAAGVAADTFSQLQAALDQYAVLVLPDQPLDEEQQLAFAQLFGELEISVGASIYNSGSPRRLSKPQLSDISNLSDSNTLLDKDDVRRMINLSNQLWHTDSSFKRIPSSVSILSAQEVVPAGGATEFADMRAAWDALTPERQAALQDLIAEHDYFHSRTLTGFDASTVPEQWRAKQPPVPQVLVRTHPATGRKSLYLASHISRIYGMSQDASLGLVNELITFATQPQFVYRHRWRVNDVVIWDNRCTMHRGTPFDETWRRSMRRATVQDTGPTITDPSAIPA